MRLLAFETATRRLSVALWLDGELLQRSADMPNSGSEVLLPWTHELLAEAGISLQQLDGIAFGAGPGGFTGLRLACGVTQGLAWGLNIPVAPVSTLQALALAAGDGDTWAVLDARMNEVYAATYRVAGDGVTELTAPVCSSPAVLPAPTFSANREASVRHCFVAWYQPGRDGQVFSANVGSAATAAIRIAPLKTFEGHRLNGFSFIHALASVSVENKRVGYVCSAKPRYCFVATTTAGFAATIAILIFELDSSAAPA